MRTLTAGTALAAVVSMLTLAGVHLSAAGEKKPARLLLVTVTKGFRHESIPRIADRIEGLGRQSGLFTVDRAGTDEELRAKTTAEGLKAFDAVVFDNTTGDLPLADRDAFLAWIESGKGLVGIHSAADTFHGWPAFIALLGAEFDYHRDQAKVQVRIDDPKHPATEGLTAPIALFDEIYLYKNFDKARVHMLLSLDKHPNTGEPGYYPIAWTREQGKGRVFYTAPGHRDDVVAADWFGRHLLGGIRWTLGR
jgi:type 1 glutamine amidotransferase